MKQDREITEHFVPDLREQWDSPHIQSCHIPISQRSFAYRRSFEESWEEATLRTLTHVLDFVDREPILCNRSWFYFGANDTWISGRGLIQRHKKYWINNYAISDIDPSQLDQNIELLVKETSEYLTFAAMALVPNSLLPTLLESIRLHHKAFIFLPLQNPDISKQLVHDTYDSVCEDNNPSISTEKILKHVCLKAGLHLDVYGGFDDRDLEICLNYCPDLIDINN